MPIKETGKKSHSEPDAERLTMVLQEKNRQIKLLKKQLELSDEYGKNLSDLLRELVRLLALIEP